MTKNNMSLSQVMKKDRAQGMTAFQYLRVVEEDKQDDGNYNNDDDKDDNNDSSGNTPPPQKYIFLNTLTHSTGTSSA